MKNESKYVALGDWVDEVSSLSSEEVKGKVVQAVVQMLTLEECKKNDEDLACLKEKVKEASAVYVEGTKEAKLKIEFLKDVLESRGINSLPLVDKEV